AAPGGTVCFLTCQANPHSTSHLCRVPQSTVFERSMVPSRGKSAPNTLARPTGRYHEARTGISGALVRGVGSDSLVGRSMDPADTTQRAPVRGGLAGHVWDWSGRSTITAERELCWPGCFPEVAPSRKSAGGLR